MMIRASILTLVLGLLLAGCGGSKDGNKSASGPDPDPTFSLAMSLDEYLDKRMATLDETTHGQIARCLRDQSLVNGWETLADITELRCGEMYFNTSTMGSSAADTYSLKLLSSMKNLELLELHSPRHTTYLYPLVGLTRLRSLSIENEFVGDLHLFPMCQLERIDFHGTSEPDVMDVISDCKNLRYLGLPNVPIAEIARHFPDLEGLDISHTTGQVDWSSLAMLSKLRILRASSVGDRRIDLGADIPLDLELEVLDLSGNWHIGNLHLLPTFKSLKALDLVSVGDVPGWIFKDMRQLEELAITGTSLGNLSEPHWLAFLTNLKKLTLFGFQAADLVVFGGMPALTDLHVSYREIDKDDEDLDLPKSLPNLRFLEINSVSSVLPLADSPSLQEIHVVYRHKSDCGDAEKFRSIRPDVRLVSLYCD